MGRASGKYWVTVTQAAIMLDVEPSRVRQYILMRRLKSVKFDGKHYLRRHHVENFVRHPVGYPKGRPYPWRGVPYTQLMHLRDEDVPESPVVRAED